MAKLRGASSNSIVFERGGFSYVICWNGQTPKGEAWYPHFQSVEHAATKHDWGNTDLFPLPQFGMPSFPAASKSVKLPLDLHLKPVTESGIESVKA